MWRGAAVDAVHRIDPRAGGNVRRRVVVSTTLALLLLSTLGLAPASGGSTAKFTASMVPSSVVAGSAGNVLKFKFVAQKRGRGVVTVTIPAVAQGVGWSAPQSANPTAKGFVSATAGTCTSAGLKSITGAGPWTITARFRCNVGQRFTVTYRKVTARTLAGSEAFAATYAFGDNAPAAVPNNPSIQVVAGKATHFDVTGLADNQIAGTLLDVTVTARDKFENVATGYRGTIFASAPSAGAPDQEASPGLIMPQPYTFVGADAGVHTFTDAVAFKASGEQTLTFGDLAKPTIDGAQTVDVLPGVATRLRVLVFNPRIVIEQTARQRITINAADAFGNIDPSYDGTVGLTYTIIDDSSSGEDIPTTITVTDGTGSALAIFPKRGDNLPSITRLTANDVGPLPAVQRFVRIFVVEPELTDVTVIPPANGDPGGLEIDGEFVYGPITIEAAVPNALGGFDFVGVGVDENGDPARILAEGLAPATIAGELVFGDGDDVAELIGIELQITTFAHQDDVIPMVTIQMDSCGCPANPYAQASTQIMANVSGGSLVTHLTVSLGIYEFFGGGMVTNSSPSGGDCNSGLCSWMIPYGSGFDLTAVPDGGADFLRWTQIGGGCDGSTAAVCHVNVFEDGPGFDLTATFVVE